MLTLRALVRNVYPTKEFTNKETGVVTQPGHKVQLEFEAIVGEGGEKKIVLDDFNVRQLGDVYRKAIGKVINVPVGMYVPDGSNQPVLYIPKGALPTLAA